MERTAAPRIAMALVTVIFGVYMVATIAAVQASLNVYASDVSGVLQLSALGGCSLVAGLVALAFQNLDRLWMSILQFALYVVALLAAMAGLDSDVFRHRPVSMLYMALIWLAICTVYYAVRMRYQWRLTGQEMARAHREREQRAAERQRLAGKGGELPEWEDTTLPPPRL